MSTTFKLTGVRQMVAALKRQEKSTDAALRSALRQQAERIITTAKQRYIPVDKGVLRSSGTVGEVRKVARTYVVEFWFHGPYAIAIHEHPSASSPPSWRGVKVKFRPRGRGPKYLLKAILDRVAVFKSEVAEHLKGRLEKA